MCKNQHTIRQRGADSVWKQTNDSSSGAETWALFPCHPGSWRVSFAKPKPSTSQWGSQCVWWQASGMLSTVRASQPGTLAAVTMLCWAHRERQVKKECQADGSGDWEESCRAGWRKTSRTQWPTSPRRRAIKGMCKPTQMKRLNEHQFFSSNSKLPDLSILLSRPRSRLPPPWPPACSCRSAHTWLWLNTHEIPRPLPGKGLQQGPT